MAKPQSVENRERMREWVATWQRAGQEMEEIRRREIVATNTQEAVQQLFGSEDAFRGLPPRTSSGLVEQQAWFAKLRAKIEVGKK